MITTTNADDQLAKKRGEELLSSIPPMPEIEAIEVEPSTDHTGDQALELTFRLRPGVTVDDGFLDRYLEFTGDVQTRIHHSDLNRFPYTRLQAPAC